MSLRALSILYTLPLAAVAMQFEMKLLRALFQNPQLSIRVREGFVDKVFSRIHSV